MKRTLVLLLLGAAAAFAIWYAVHARSARTSGTAVTALLPKETLGFVQMPDLNRARAQWHQTDLYKLWREPAVQNFLQKPLAKTQAPETVRQKLQELDRLEIRDAFLAVTAWENRQVKLLGGFHFKGSQSDAEKIIGPWRTRAQQSAPAIKHETLAYEQHRIEVMSQDAMTIATAYDGQWFLAANDVAALQTLLDRADKRASDIGTTLAGDEHFLAASKHMPTRYGVRAYARTERYFEQLAPKLAQHGGSDEQLGLLRNVRSLSAATGFEKGKIRDVLFVAMPKAETAGDLSRASLTLATRESFLYLASFLNLPRQLPATDPATAVTSQLPAALQSFTTAFNRSGLTYEAWQSALGSEVGVIGEWPPNSRMPAVFATVPVKDAAKARQLVAALTAAGTESAAWTSSEKDGVQYHTQAPMNPMIPIAPTIAISDRLLVVGHDPVSVEAVFKRSTSTTSELAGADTYKNAEGLLPAPRHSFAYVDAALLYSRLDHALRPMLIMAAVFMPGIAETVDLNKLPAAEVITRHLSPIVMTQSYETDGYVTESIGPISIYQALLGIAASTGAGASFYHQQMQGGASTPAVPAPVNSLVAPTPIPDEAPEP